MNLVQIEHPAHGRRIALVSEPYLVLFEKFYRSTYQFFNHVLGAEKEVKASIETALTTDKLDYNFIYSLESDWRILPPVDCPGNLMLCVLSGTGLTHKASAANRQKMHEQEKAQDLTDSMKMYLMGEKDGKPLPYRIGVQPEWFYKGNGLNLKGHGETLTVPNYADDGGDEPEVAGVYLISPAGVPFRLGFAQGNEFSDHVMERKNYLYLAPSKIRNCSIGPELVLDIPFKSIDGRASILRAEKELWSKEIHTGEEAMAHSLANLEHHHFKYQQHRLPGQLHIHFFGASAFSFGDNIKLEDGDQMHVAFNGMGRPLVNTIALDRAKVEISTVRPILGRNS
jgi:hypothetical protein